ncbi:MAG: TetR/AcrR family transcriptional regulator [Bacilli bacterium]|nr:TetR/AcrR family transcriptional regulator [Bacilli bacterium]
MKTREKICLALFKMIQNKSIYDVTITDIVNEANISRGSFYNHFKDIKSVVLFIEDSFVNDLRHCVHLTGDVEKDVIDTIDEITAAFKKLRSSIRSIYLYLPASIQFDIREKLVDLVLSSEDMKKSFGDNELNLRFLVNGVAGLYSEFFNKRINNSTLEDLASIAKEKLIKAYRERNI